MKDAPHEPVHLPRVVLVHLTQVGAVGPKHRPPKRPREREVNVGDDPIGSAARAQSLSQPELKPHPKSQRRNRDPFLSERVIGRNAQPRDEVVEEVLWPIGHPHDEHGVNLIGGSDIVDRRHAELGRRAYATTAVAMLTAC